MNYAKDNNFTIVTFDADFADLVSIKGTPPKIIWLRFYDQRSSAIVLKLKEKEREIKDFAQDMEFDVLEIK